MRSVNSHFITEIMRSERLSLVGSMANSIIHDLKNPICIVRCCSDLIASETNDPRLRELTSMLDGAVDGMLAMTQELLDYARGSTQLNKQLISVWGMLDELNQQSLRLLPGKNIHFVKHIRYDGNLEIDRARFVRMLSSLIKNSREAMVGGGILTITTDLVQDQVVLRISDTGVGIPSEILPRLFEPFMTHGKSSGTGLGLAIAPIGGGSAWRKNFAFQCLRQRHDRRHSPAETERIATRRGYRAAPLSRCASCNFRCAVENRKSANRLPRGVTVTQRPLEALFLVRIQAG